MTVTTTTDETALLRAVCESPMDDAPRLVYADWLEENGGDVPCPGCTPMGGESARDPRVPPGRVMVVDPNGHGRGHPKVWWEDCKTCSGSGRVDDGRAARAEFIRVQCELATVDQRTVAHSEPWASLRRRENELLTAHWRVWSIPQPPEGKQKFRRGFVERVECKLSDWYGVRCGCDPVGSRLLSTEGGYTWARCNRCDKGRVGGIGPKVVAIEPVTEVILGDVEPARGTFQRLNEPEWPLQGKNFWVWHPEERNSFASGDLPWAVYNHLTGSCSPYARQYLSREAAFDALSRALVDWARTVAGLSELRREDIPVSQG